MEVAVIGSGVAGFAAADALARRGLRPLVLDVGETLDSERLSIVKKLQKSRLEGLDPEDRALIGENSTLYEGVLPKKLHFGSDYIYASDREFARTASKQGGRVAFPTFARGGFSNIWGAAALPTDACDMADWPIARSALDPYYGMVAELMPMLDGGGTLASAFPLYHRASGQLDAGPQGRALLEDLEAARDKLTACSTLYGHARLCIHTENQPHSEGKGCVNCGECFIGCARGSIFSTIPLLSSWQSQRRIEYRSRLHVEEINQTEGRATVRAFDLATRRRIELEFDAVFLAAGPLNTTRILLRSAGLYDRPVRLKESQKFAIPLLRARSRPSAIEVPSVTLASAFIETKTAALSDHWIHLQVVPMNDMIARAVKLPIRGFGGSLMRPVLRRTMIAWCGMHSDHSSWVETTLRRRDDTELLELDHGHEPKAVQAARVVARDLFRKGMMFKTLFVPNVIRISNPGSGTHCGGSFPMRKSPRSPMETDALGRPFGWSNVFVVDAAAHPSIPGTTLAMSVMANAMRIASLAPIGSP
jgi:choline dehydrogenase-like flavoprotein